MEPKKAVLESGFQVLVEKYIPVTTTVDVDRFDENLKGTDYTLNVQFSDENNPIHCEFCYKRFVKKKR